MQPIERYFNELENQPVTKAQGVLLTFPLRPGFVKHTMDYGLGYLYCGLKSAGYATCLNLSAWKKKDFLRELSQGNTHVVGIKTYGSTTLQTAETIRLIREKNPETLILVGGPAVDAEPERILERLPADFAFHGECETALPAFLDHWFSRNPAWEKTPGLIRKSNGKIIINERALVRDVNSIPYLPLHKMHPTPRAVNYYYRDHPSAVLLKSRGCPCHCRFCANPCLFRKRDVDKVVEEIQYLRNRYNIREIAFFDNNFNADRHHTRALCERLLEKNLAIPFNVVHGMRVDSIDEKTVSLMARAGCYKVSLGVESGDQNMLDYLNKGYRLDDLPEKVGLLKKYNVQVQAFVMIGLPRETDAQRKKTFRLTRDLPFDHVTYNIYTPYPGTELYDELEESGYLKERGYDLGTYSRTATDNRMTGHGPDFLRWCARYYFLRFYLRPKKMLHTLGEFLRHPDALVSMLFAFYKTYLNAG